MKTTMIRTVMVVLLLSCTVAVAQKVELYGGYSYTAQGSSASKFTGLNGWAAGVEVGFPKIKPFSIAASISGGYSNQKTSGLNQSLHQYTYLVGPRLSQRVSRVRIFENVMFGAVQLKARLGDQSDNATSFAFALGGGADIQLKKHINFRPAQLDYLLTRIAGNNQNNFRYSTGLVFRF